jgi:ABC-type sulfate/molybdate transport systems ATPase subunit
VLLLDEPTSALDDAAKLVVEAALQAAMASVEGACLIVTHDDAQAARLAQRTLVMREGVLRDESNYDVAAPGQSQLNESSTNPGAPGVPQP